MRYNQRVALIKKGSGHSRYNPDLGRKETSSLKARVVPCHYSPLSLERSMEVFGSWQKDLYVCRLKNKLPFETEEAMVDSKRYKIIRVIHYRHRVDLFLEAV